MNMVGASKKMIQVQMKENMIVVISAIKRPLLWVGSDRNTDVRFLSFRYCLVIELYRHHIWLLSYAGRYLLVTKKD